jgi:hypothetical protein
VARVEFERVTKDFHGGVRAVDCLDLEIDDGKCMVFVGPAPEGFQNSRSACKSGDRGRGSYQQGPGRRGRVDRGEVIGRRVLLA